MQNQTSNLQSYTSIGLDPQKAQELVGELNLLLSNYQVFYQNVRGFHWNIRGTNFFELHAKFEELYTDLQIKIDEIAERILTLGHTPLHHFEDYLKNAQVKARQNVQDGLEAVSAIMDALTVLLKTQRNILQLSDDAADEGTNALMSDYIREQEKLAWMYAAYLG